MNTNTRNAIIIVGAIAAIIAGLLVWQKKTVVTIPAEQNGGVVTTDGPITIQPNMVDVAQDTYLYGISGSYPQFTQADVSFNKKIEKTFTDELKSFKENASADFQARQATGGDAFTADFANSGMYMYGIETTIIQSNNQFISAVIHFGGYTGGAHGYNNVITFNYDVANKREITLADFYPGDNNYLSKVAATARDLLTTRLTTLNGGILDSDMQAMLMDGTDPVKPENYRNFTFIDDTITIYFNEYQIGPYVLGEQSIIILRQ